MTASCKWLLNVGFLTLLAPFGLTMVLVALHLLGAINAWVFPLVHVGAFCLFGGTSCIVAAQVLSRRPVQVSRPSNHRRRRQLCWGLAIWAPIKDIEALMQTIPATKQLVVSADAGHHQLIGVDRPLWDISLSNFLKAI